ncbi:MAG: Hsp20/alpha crystallin family protein [Candidatus Njordarchaeia archaeon]
MSFDEFFYYEENIIIYGETPKKFGQHGSHIWEEDFEAEESGSKKAKIYEKHLKDEIVYYIELPGVTSPEDIDIVLEDQHIKVKARLKKVVIYHGLRKDTQVQEYTAEIKLPFPVEPSDVSAEFDKTRGMLVIRVRKGKKKEPHRINIEKVY